MTIGDGLFALAIGVAFAGYFIGSGLRDFGELFGERLSAAIIEFGADIHAGMDGLEFFDDDN